MLLHLLTYICLRCRALPSRNIFRRYGLVLPFDLLSRSVEQDVATTFGIDDAKLLEIGLKFSL